MKKLILIPLILTLVACSFGTRNEFEGNYAKWQSAGVKHYRYLLFIGCFCPYQDIMPLTIEVKDKRVVSMSLADGTPVLPTDPQFETFSSYATIDRLFSELKADLDGKAEEVTVSYDATYGFPSRVSIDFIKLAMDDELSLTVSDFEKLP